MYFGTVNTKLISQFRRIQIKIRYRLMLISSQRYKLIPLAIIKQQLIAVNYLDAFALAPFHL
ncbi:hypothetical protein SAMN05428947_113165 [Mucilaginibacter sp. OK283]|nr:hypothetical protein SAMN05428947_113165 [Mucilaginibacter sp. OK283]